MLPYRLLITAFVASAAIASSGLAFGFSSSAAFQIFLSVEWSALFASCINVGGLVGSLISGHLLSTHGRRWTLCCACLPGFIGWLWLLLSVNAVYEKYSPTLLFISGRMLTGLSAGMIIPASAAYLVEIAPPEFYGAFGTLPQIGIVSGIALSYVTGGIFPWEHVALINAIILLFLFFLSQCLPESPKWLIKSGQIQKANATQSWLYDSLGDNHDVEALKLLDTAIAAEPTNECRLIHHIFPCSAIPRTLRTRLFIVMLLMVLQQLTGINGVLYFAESVCMFGGLSWPSTCAMLLGISQLVFTVGAMFIVNRMSRKCLLQWSALIMCIAHLLHAIIIMFAKPYTSFMMFGKLMVFIFLLGFSIGWGPLPILISMDLFPTAHRGFAVASAVSVSWVTSFLVTLTFEPLNLFAGAASAFCLFSLFCFFAYLFTVRYVPESITPDSR